MKDINTVLEIAEIGEPIAFAVSGGLDSCTITRWLTDRGVKAICFTADLGQPDEKDISHIGDRIRKSGAYSHHFLHLQDHFAEAGLKLIQAQAFYEGGYWNITGIARHIIVKGILEAMTQHKLSILAHGSTGRGNDQIRFQVMAHMLNPEVKLYAPWRDPIYLDKFQGRAEMIDFCQAHGLPIRATKDTPYSTDANLLGITYEGGKLEDLKTPSDFVTPTMGVYPKNAPDKVERFVVRFEQGRPVAINENQVSLLDGFKLANQIGGRNGVGIGVHVVENRIVGLKSRGVYEQPGIDILSKCYRFLLQLILDRASQKMFDQMASQLGENIYYGLGFDLPSQMGFRAIEPVTNLATGTITVDIYKGHVTFVSAEDVPHSIYTKETTSMENIGSFSHLDSEGLLRILSLSARAKAHSRLTHSW
ncbi:MULTISPECIES: argininosuccinate synthase [unclassified Moorena]|uniref:argininosuccinate synthase n=1 Tax=unclassified Moorena TaxID=2683338 RepID=UPI0013BA4B1E|nr:MULTISPECIES: argininosuccinate synthase [unclassified Moorena]NEP33341.1 argininosuccinate synthase [Moorena sp. SIO3B2]NEQ06148.1 argininosuccinate synthase [Moorena sp. SIO4E2]NER89469.1 argininosuccinate synthase [Moorena sp. SIO3A2]NET67816.1 argininosuccinate synthase [Moorena sp. SIO1G6]